jgi:hypothetical protein
VTATTLRAQPSGLSGRTKSAGDAQERAATNPMAALPCARTPLPNPLPAPLLIPLLIPSTATVGVWSLATVLFGLVRVTDPSHSPAKPPPDWPGSRWSQKQWRATHARLHAGAFLSGRPPTNPVGGLPADNPGRCHNAGHAGWSHG